MATIIEHKLKNGRKSYTVQIKYNNKFYSTTWKRPENMKENECKRKLEHITSELNLKATNKINLTNENITFNECADQWLIQCKSSNSLSHYLRSKEQLILLREHFGNKLMKSITLQDVENFCFYLNEKKIEIARAKLIKPLDGVIKNMKILDICKNCNFTKTTFQFVRKEKIIELKTALAICKYLKLDFKEYFEKIITSHPYAYESKLKFKRTLSAIFNFALKHEYITKNYASSIFIRGLIKGETNEKDILTEEETKKLHTALLNEENKKRQLSISILLYMGLRVGELSGLEWKDIDFENHTMFIQRSTNFLPKYGECTKSPKTKNSKRKLDIPDHIYDMLVEYKREYDIEKEKLGSAWIDRDRIICRWNGLPTYTGTYTIWLTDILIKNGIRKVTPHSLRHTCITTLLRKQIAPQIVSKWAGHSSTTVTLDTYAHFLPEDKNICAKMINTAFN